MRVTFGTHDTLFLEDKHLFVLLRKVEIDLEAPVGNVVGVTVPAEGVRMRKLASKVARLPTKKFLQRCWSWFLLEVPTETGPGKVAPGAVRGRTVSLRKTEVLEAKRGKSSQARVFVLASRHGEKDRVLVGRDARRCDLVIEHPSVSGVHADLRWTGEAWQVTDCESENGTFVSEERLTPGDAAFLNARQPIYFGGYRTVLLSAEDLHGFAVRLAGG